MKWSQALIDYQNFLKIERGLSKNSVSNYCLDIKKLIKFLELHEMEVSPIKINTDTLQEFIYETAKNINVRSQARLISGLNSFFNYLIFEDYRTDNPMELIESPKIGRKLPDTLAIEEIDKIIATLDLSTPEGERNRTMLETLYCCGLRVSELVNLKISDLFFEEGFIKVSGKGDKERFVPVASSTIKYIDIYISDVRPHINVQKSYDDFVFLNRRGKNLTRAMIFTIIKRATEKAGIKKNISPHTFRHSFATHLLQGGADLRAIQQMLGHESITTTEVYMHLDRNDLANTIEKHHPRKDF